jgi:hypothetical protein
MRVNYTGKIRRIPLPKDRTLPIDEFRKIVESKFAPKNNVSQVSQAPAQSIVSADFLDEDENLGLSIMEEVSNPLSWSEVVCFYEDSEGDLNVISEDEDFSDAMAYLNYKKSKLGNQACLECSILPEAEYT